MLSSPIKNACPPDAPRIAAIIPLYNGSKYIASALESVLAQRLPPNEIVVVNDGSTDDGPGIVEEMAARHPIRLLHQSNSGQSSARNYGVAQTTSELIALLDQDDIWYADHLEQLVRPFMRSTERDLGWVYGDLDEIDATGRLIARRCLRFGRTKNPKRDIFDCLATDMLVLPSATLMARRAFDAVGGFDEALSGYEDDDLFRRMFLAGFENYFIPRSLSQWRMYPESSSYSPRMAVSRMRYLRKLLAEFPDDPRRDRYFGRSLLAPRFLPAVIHDYCYALRFGAVRDVRAALENVRFVSKIHNWKVRGAIFAMLPILRCRPLAKALLPLAPVMRSTFRRILS